MKIVELLESNKAVHYRATIKELPVNRWAKFQKYLVQSAGLGSDMAAVDTHFNKVFRLQAGGFYDESTRELYNLYNNIFLMLNEIDIESVAFNCLVDSITHYKKVYDEEAKGFTTVVDRVEKIDDYSEDGLIRLATRLGEYGLRREQVLDLISEVKKKSIQN